MPGVGVGRCARFWSAFLVVVALMWAGGFAPAHAATAYDGLLARYGVAGADGVTRVDYAGWRGNSKDRAALDQFIAEQAALAPSGLGKSEQFAYWANLYNAITLKVILDAYPVPSIRDVKSAGVWLDPKAYTGPWVEKRVTVEGRALSLDDIEHKILRPTFGDARVHYAVNCASYGCPNIGLRSWQAATLDAELDIAARSFVNHPRGVRVGPDGKLTVSSIYVWFKDDFGGNDAGVIAHLKKYAGPELAKKLETATGLAGDQYDWTLNDTAKAGVKG